MQARFCKISETLKDNSVIKLARVPDQQITISGFRCEIRTEAIPYVVDATAQFRRGDHKTAPWASTRFSVDGTAPQRF
jgi:hypothetical protein